MKRTSTTSKLKYTEGKKNIQIKATQTHFTSVRLTKKTKDNKWWQECGNEEHDLLWIGMSVSTVILGNSMEMPQKC